MTHMVPAFLILILAAPALADGPPTATPAAVAPAATQPSYDQLMADALKLKVMGQKLEAVAKLADAAKLKPDAASPHEKMCTLLYEAGKLDAALASCKGWMQREKNRMRHGQIKGLVMVLEKRLQAQK